MKPQKWNTTFSLNMTGPTIFSTFIPSGPVTLLADVFLIVLLLLCFIEIPVCVENSVDPGAVELFAQSEIYEWKRYMLIPENKVYFWTRSMLQYIFEIHNILFSYFISCFRILSTAI